MFGGWDCISLCVHTEVSNRDLFLDVNNSQYTHFYVFLTCSPVILVDIFLSKNLHINTLHTSYFKDDKETKPSFNKYQFFFYLNMDAKTQFFVPLWVSINTQKNVTLGARFHFFKYTWVVTRGEVDSSIHSVTARK